MAIFTTERISPQAEYQLKHCPRSRGLGSYNEQIFQDVLDGKAWVGFADGGHQELLGRAEQLGYFPQNGKFVLVNFSNGEAYQSDNINELTSLWKVGV